MNDFFSGHKNKYGYFVRFSTGSNGVFNASSSVADIQLNDCIGQNTEFLFGASSQIRLNLSRQRNGILAQVDFTTSSLAYSFGPFPVTILPDGSSAPLFVSMEGWAITPTTASVTVHLRQYQNEVGAFLTTDNGNYNLSGGVPKEFQFNVVSSSFTGSYLQIPSTNIRTTQFYTYTSRSVNSPKETSNELLCYLDVFVAGTGSTKVSTGSFAITKLFAQEVIPRVSGSY